jgi:hypothetical protein
MSADSETASYTSATALSDNERTALSDRRRLHDRRSADDRFGRMRSPITNSGCVAEDERGGGPMTARTIGDRPIAVHRAEDRPRPGEPERVKGPASSRPDAAY